MKRGPYSTKRNAAIDELAAQIVAERWRARPKEAGQMVKARCPHCQSRMVEADWIPRLDVLSLNCIACSYEWVP